MSTALLTETRTIEREGAARLRATVTLGAGELRIAGGATGALHGEFATNVPAWRPEITYAVEGAVGHLTIRQPEGEPRPKVQNARQRWALAFPDAVPLDLRITAGAATGTLILGALALERLAIETGAGTLSIDLTTARAALDATIQGGVINAEIRLPAEHGVRVAVDAPIATVRADGLSHAGNAYTNARYAAGESPVRVRIAGGVVTLALHPADNGR
jgi:hypothetical protein